MPENTPVLRAEGLTKLFGHGKHAMAAVDHVSFTLHAGEVVSLLGESGSGKSTVARMLLHLLPPSSGAVYFRGEDASRLRSQGQLVGFWRQVQAVFQDPFSSFNSFYTVRRLLELAFRLRQESISREEREERIRAAVAAVGLNADELLEKRPHQLSGGQRQRIMLARILLIEPAVLIADEPTSMIDASSRSSILSLLLELRQRLGMAILFITHDFGLAYYTSDRLLVMHRGRIIEDGSADEVVTTPREKYTRRLIADVPVLGRKWEL